MEDKILHPQHYVNHSLHIEPKDILNELPFCLGNVIKYMIRRDEKGDVIENLQKAYVYWEDSRNIVQDKDLVRLAVFRFSDDDVLRTLGKDMADAGDASNRLRIWKRFGETITDLIFSIADERKTASLLEKQEVASENPCNPTSGNL